MVNMLYLAIALASIYGIGKKIINEKAGLLAAFIFSSFPGVISLSRVVYAEFHLMCLIVLTLFFLLKTDFFTSRKYSLLFGISLGLTALTKWEFPITMAGPFLLYLLKSRPFIMSKRNTPIPNRHIWTNLPIAILISILISFLWYSLSFKDIIWRLFLRPARILSENPSGLTSGVLLLQKFSYLPLAIVNTFISFFYLLLLILASIGFVYKIVENRHKLARIKSEFFFALFFILWILVPCLVLSLTLSTPSHIMPVLPAIAIIIALGIFSFKNRIARLILISLIILYGLGSHLHSFVNFGKADAIYKLKLYLSSDSKFYLTVITDNIPRDDWEHELFYPPDSRDWKFKEILSFIKEDYHNMKSQPVIFVLGPREIFSCFSFQYYKLLENHQLFIEPRGNDRSPPPKDPSKFDYVIVNPMLNNNLDEANLSETIKFTLNIDEPHKIGEFKKSFFNKYRLIKEYLLPDNTKALIYKLANS